MSFHIDNLDNMTDIELLELINSNSDNSSVVMDYLIERHKGLVLAQARSLYLVGGDKDDLIQEGMIGLYKAVREYNPEKSDNFVVFARTVIYGQICNAIKASTRKKNQPLNNYVSFNQPITHNGHDGENTYLLSDVIEASSSSNPEELLIDKENASMIEYELGKCLSGLEKEVYTMYVGGMDYKQIASTLNRTPKAIDNALTRIRRKLSALLS